MENSSLEFLRLISEVLIVPVVGILWGIQGRLSRIEGKLYHLLRVREPDYEKDN
jgi:hypothetical protein